MAGSKVISKTPRISKRGRGTRKKKPQKRKYGGALISGSGRMTNFVKNDPFPPSCYKQMVYAGTGQLFVTSTNKQFGTELSFKLNSIYDPYDGTTGTLNTTAYGQAQMAGLYHRYKVNGVKLEVQFFDPSHDGIVCGILLNNPSNLAEALGGKDCGQLAKMPMSWSSSISNTGSQKMYFKQYWPMNVVFNMTKGQYLNDIDNTTSATNGSPATLAKALLAIADANFSNAERSINFTIKITYYTYFYQRKQYAINT
jgi:hypothetical protein